MQHVKTRIARHTHVSGQIDTDADLEIEGRVEGHVRGALVAIARTGVVLADVIGRRVQVKGIVIGNVAASERIEVGPGGRVVGDMRAPTVEVADGALHDGQVERRPSRALPPAGGLLPRRPAAPSTRAPRAPAGEPRARAWWRPPAPPPEPSARPVPRPPRLPIRARIVTRSRGPAMEQP